MAILKRVTGAKYGATLESYFDTSDAADTLRNLTAGASSLEYVPGTSEFDFETEALGYVRGGKGNSLTLRLNNQAEFLTADYDGSTPHSDYWLSFWIRGVVLPGELPPDNTIFSMYQQIGSGTNVTFSIRTGTGNANEGFNLLNSSNLPGNSSGGMVAISGVSGAAFRWNSWYRVTLHLRRGANGQGQGMHAVYGNGMLVRDTTGYDGTGSQINFGASGERNLVLPAWSNVRWNVAGPIESYNGTDIPLEPQWQRNKGPFKRVFLHGPRFVLPADSEHPEQGRFWRGGGSGTVVGSSYGAGGGLAYRSRIRLQGDGNEALAISNYKLAGPYYQRGWQTVGFADVCVPNGCTLLLGLMNDENTVPAVLLQVANGELQQIGASPQTVLSWSQPGSPTTSNQVRYSLLIHLAQSGEAAVTLINLTNSPASMQTVFSAPLPLGWTPQSLGRVILAAMPTALDVEVGMVGIGNEFGITLTDSLSTANQTSDSSGNIHTLALTTVNLPLRFNNLEERQQVPGGAHNQWHVGMPPHILFAPSGRSGLSRANWTANALPGFEHSRNLLFFCVDLGSINDILAIGSGQGPAASALLVERVKEMIDRTTANGNRVWLTTMLTRDHSGAGSSYNAERLQAIADANQAVRENVAAWNTKGLIQFSDVAHDYTDHREEYPAGDAMWQDITHPSGAGYIAIARRMAATLEIPRTPRTSQRNRIVSGNRRLATALLGR